MNEVHISRTDTSTTRELIVEMHNGALTEEQSRTLDHYLGPTSDLWVGFISGRPVCAWGLMPPTMLSDRAYLWLYASPLVDEHKFLFVRRSQRVIEELRQTYPTIYGVCDVSNTRAIRWLKWLGAKFAMPNGHFAPFVIGG